MKQTPEVVEEVAALIRLGLSYSQIAERVNREKAEVLPRPLTRAGVAGIAYRGKLRPEGARSHPVRKPRVKQTKPKQAPRKWWQPAPPEAEKPKPFVAEVLPSQDVARISLAEMEARHCRWPVGDPRDRDFGYCGLQRVNPYDVRAPYCAIHRKRARASGASE